MATIALQDPKNSFSKAKLDAMPAKARKEMIRRARLGTRNAAPRIQAAAQGHVQMALSGNTAAKSIRAKVWAQKIDKFPALQISSKIPWLGVHQHGKRIQGKLLLQIGRGKSRRGAFRALVAKLMAAKLTFWRKGRNGNLYLWAKPPKGTRGLGGAKKAERAARKAAGGSGRIGKDEAYPIAILLKGVTIHKRLAVDRVIKQQMPVLVRAIEGAI